MPKWVYSFGDGAAEGDAEMRDLLGGKAANLAEMSNLGIPVPPGFTITTEVCNAFFADGRDYPDGLAGEVDRAIATVEKQVKMRFGDRKRPLLLSVRSGGRVSMPGMMDTVLNLGLNDETVRGLAKRSGDARFAYDSYRRFIQMYSDVVLGVEHYHFEDLIESHKTDAGVTLDTELGVDDWKHLVAAFKGKVVDQSGAPFPDDVREQLWGAIGAVFGSWDNTRAKTYRRIHSIPNSWGTAVSVQAMVFGNMGPDSATGVAFTRNPSTGAREIYGEYLINAQGEDVVAGIRTPQHIAEAARREGKADLPSMEETLPAIYAELSAVMDRLERHYRDMQDIEFTVQRGKLWMLQTRAGKRTAKAAIKIAVDMVNEGLVSKEDVIGRIEPNSLDQLLHVTLDPNAPRDIIARGLPASPGAACGIVVFESDEAEKLAAEGQDVILVRVETSPEDIHGMHAALGILTSRGGMTSHAAVVARGMGRPCVAGAGSLHIDVADGTMAASGRIVVKGQTITIDGSTGDIMVGRVATINPELSGDFGILMSWADDIRRMSVRANAETPLDARTAREFGAEGIGLCRTEHMFFDAERIVSVREMILAGDEAGRRAALEKLLPMQRQDFIELFRIMAGQPVTIRLLDPPLHEFLPKSDDELAAVAEAAGIDISTLRYRAGELEEVNPMLGHRGCRLGVTFPEIYEMQARAVFEAVIKVERATGATVEPEIMIPLVASRREFDFIRENIERLAEDVSKEQDCEIRYLIGTMIELPRAALRAGDIATTAQFFSFGTNDLTQTTYGISRDDAARFLDDYIREGIFDVDPFVSLDTEGVGELIRIAVERGRRRRPDIKLGICGEHGGDPASIDFCEDIGLDYVSCSPYRVPIARLAAAQATLVRSREKS